MKLADLEDALDLDGKGPANVPPTSEAAVSGAVVGTLVGFDDVGRPLVRFRSKSPQEPRAARATVAVQHEDVGGDVVVVFEQSDAERPIIIGRLQSPNTLRTAGQRSVKLDVDGETVTVTANEQLVLKCGKASLTLTKAGKILLNGAYVSSCATGVNRIRGGSVQLN